jgi:adenylate cyclase
MSSHRRKRIHRALWGVLILGMIALIWDGTESGIRLERLALDYRYSKWNRDRQASPRVVVVDIDEESIKMLAPHYGRWPWPRKVYKELIEFFAVGEPAGVFFDLLFTESSLIAGDDDALAQTAASSGLPSFAMQLLKENALEGSVSPQLPEKFAQRFGLKWESDVPAGFLRRDLYRDFSLPVEAYQKSAPRIHVVTSEPDSDGVFRRMPLFFHYAPIQLPSLTLGAVLADLPPESLLKWNAQDSRLLGIEAGKYRFPVDTAGRLPLHFYKPDRGPEVIRFAAVMASAAQLQKGEVQDPVQLKVNPLDFKGKFILIGGSAAGLEDLKITPTSAAYPGVLLHATAISNILEGDYLQSLPAIPQLLLAILTVLVVYGFALLSSNIWVRFLVPQLWIAGYCAAGLYLFKFHSIGLQLARPAVLGGLALVDSIFYLFIVEQRDKAKMKESLSKYLPPSLADQIIQSGEDPRAEVGRLQELSVLFSDIRGFTSISEKMEPKALVMMLNEYLGKMTDVVFECRGTLDKFIGDAVMAFWGAPVTDSEHALHAVRCALGMKAALETLNKDWSRQGMLSLQIGIGINTGPVIVGNIGSEKRLDYTVIGDNVNLASRLEGLTKQYGVGVLISETAEELTRKWIVSRPVDLVRVKGKARYVRIYEPLGETADPRAEEWRGLARSFEDALSDYQQARFESALKKFERIHSDSIQRGGEDPLAQVFVERCAHLLKEPPENWDGIYVAVSK